MGIASIRSPGTTPSETTVTGLPSQPPQFYTKHASTPSEPTLLIESPCSHMTTLEGEPTMAIEQPTSTMFDLGAETTLLEELDNFSVISLPNQVRSDCMAIATNPDAVCKIPHELFDKMHERKGQKHVATNFDKLFRQLCTPNFAMGKLMRSLFLSSVSTHSRLSTKFVMNENRLTLPLEVVAVLKTRTEAAYHSSNSHFALCKFRAFKKCTVIFL